MSAASKRQIVAATTFAILFLFFFQLISDFVASIYAFGLMGTDIPPEIITVLLLFSPILILFFPGLFSRRVFLTCVIFMLLCRVIEPNLDTRGRMIVAGIGVSCFLLFLPGFLQYSGQTRNKTASWLMVMGLIMAVALSILLRSLNSSLDLSTSGWFQIIGLLLALIAAGSLLSLVWPKSATNGSETKAGPNGARNIGKIIMLSAGIVATLLLLYFAFTTPAVISRWTGESYLLITALVMIVLTLFTWILADRPELLRKLSSRNILLWNGLFVILLTLTIRLNQLSFPADQELYPMAVPDLTPWPQITLILSILLLPIVPLDFILLVGEVVDQRPSLRSLGAGFSVSALFLLLMVLAHVFTSTYAYIPLVGLAFRDKYWLVYLVNGLVLIASTFFISRQRKNDLAAWTDFPRTYYYPVVLLVLTIGSVVGVVLNAPRSSEPSSRPEQLTILTYNIRQGYSLDGLRNYEGQLEVIRNHRPDIIGLQESDTSRIAGGNADIVRFFADNLDMYSYYGPKTVNGTFGIALLSRYPIENPRTHYLFSEGEQVAVIDAQVPAGDKVFNVFATHLDNDGPMIQQEQFLSLIDGKQDLIAMADFNFEMDTEQYEMTTKILDDSWWLMWPQGIDEKGLYPEEKIDYIFLSPGSQVIDARFIDDPASDHPAVTADIEWEVNPDN